jgi:two-component system, sensor histidine kinase
MTPAANDGAPMPHPTTAQERDNLLQQTHAAPAREVIDAERLRLLCRQTVRAPLGVLLAASFIAYVMAPYVGHAVAWGWAGTALGLWCARAAAAAWLLRRPPPHAQVLRWIRWLVAAATLSGMVAGASVVLFHRVPPIEWALLTMVLCAWAAGGVAVSAAVPAAFYGLVTFFLAPLAVGWSVSDFPLRLPVAGLLMFFLFYLIVYARDGAALVARALRVGFDNEQLALQLQRSEAEAHAARQRAEQANLAKSRFLAAASHDLRQPLHSLVLLLDHAVHMTGDARVAQTLGQAARSANSLHRLFTGLLDLSRFEAGQVTPDVQPVALGALLERIDDDFRTPAEAKGLRFDCARTQAWVRSDPVMLDRILRNLLDNAVKYTESGGVAVQVVEQGSDELRVTVRDSGIGIAPADRDRVFEEYFQVRNPARDRERGIGLGLAIVKRLADLLQVPIELESAPGRGSTFTLVLPRCDQPPAIADESDSVGTSLAALHGRVVVLVEDNAEVIDAMLVLLTDWGCRTVLAGDSAGAMAQLDAQELEPDAIIADWRLGGPQNGLQVVEQLQARYGPVRAAIITGEIADASFDEPRGVTVMRKPLRAHALSRWLLVGDGRS